MSSSSSVKLPLSSCSESYVIVLDDDGIDDGEVPLSLLSSGKTQNSSAAPSLAQFKTPPPTNSPLRENEEIEQNGKQKQMGTRKRKRIVIHSDDEEGHENTHEDGSQNGKDNADHHAEWSKDRKSSSFSSSTPSTLSSVAKKRSIEAKAPLNWLEEILQTPSAPDQSSEKSKEGLKAKNGIYDMEEEDDEDEDDEDFDDGDEEDDENDEDDDDDEELVLVRALTKSKPPAKMLKYAEKKNAADDEDAMDAMDDDDVDDEDYLDEEEEEEDDTEGSAANSFAAEYPSFSSFGSSSSSPAPFRSRSTDVRRLFSDLMRRHAGHLLSAGWRLCWDRSRTCAGLTDFRRKTISLSTHFITSCDLLVVTNTILHEIAHALVGATHNHDSVWRRKALEIGCDGQRCHNFRFAHAPLIFRCKGGCWADQRYKRSGKEFCCSICGSEVEYIPNTPKNAHLLTDAQKNMKQRQQQERQQRTKRRRRKTRKTRR